MLKRRQWAWGALLAIGVLATTTAMTVDAEDSVVHFEGRDDFDIVVAGSREPGWTPAEMDWDQGRPQAYSIRLTDDGSRAIVGPGESLSLRIAARNAMPNLSAWVVLQVSDPDDHDGEIDPVTGRYAELFEQMRFTIRDGGTVLLDDVSGATVDQHPYAWPESWAPGEHRVLDVTITMPSELSDEWQGAGSNVQFRFEALND